MWTSDLQLSITKSWVSQNLCLGCSVGLWTKVTVIKNTEHLIGMKLHKKGDYIVFIESHFVVTIYYQEFNKSYFYKIKAKVKPKPHVKWLRPEQNTAQYH